MRRGISLLFILFFALGPLATLSFASDDAALPACCRRNGKHHCAMYMQMMAARMVVPPDAPPIAKSPSHCPDYPRHLSPWTTTPHALVVASCGLPVLHARPHSPATVRADALLNPIRILASRGPPAFA